MTKAMNHRLEKLSSLLDAKETQLNVENKNEISKYQKKSLELQKKIIFIFKTHFSN